MVFQSYALYPHMNLFDNMAFGLKLAKKHEGIHRGYRRKDVESPWPRSYVAAEAGSPIGRSTPAGGARPGNRAESEGIPFR